MKFISPFIALLQKKKANIQRNAYDELNYLTGQESTGILIYRNYLEFFIALLATGIDFPLKEKFPFFLLNQRLMMIK